MNIIVGKRSNLSQRLNQRINNCILISSENFEIEFLNTLKYIDKPCSIIFNNFQNSTLLNDYSRLDKYIESSILITSKILTLLSKSNVIVSKIIYTSSSSVYGNNKFCSEKDDTKPMSLQAALKFANEELIKSFCLLNKIDFTIARIFNMYGGNDHFSIISKILNTYFNKDILNIVNDGNGIRDYVYIDDVVDTYRALLNTNKSYPIINIAKGSGKKLLDIINYLEHNNIKIQTNNTQRDEIKASVADTSLLSSLLNTENFMNVEEYIIKKLKGID